MNKYDEHDLYRIYATIKSSIENSVHRDNFTCPPDKLEYIILLERKINKILNKYPEVINFLPNIPKQYSLGTIFTKNGFISCAKVLIALNPEALYFKEFDGTTMYDHADESDKGRLIKPENYYSNQVEMMFNKKFNASDAGYSKENKTKIAIYSMARENNLTENPNLEYVKAMEKFIISKLEEFPEILQYDKPNCFGFIFAQHDYRDCALYVVRKNKSKLNIKDSYGLTMVNYAHPVLINTLKRFGYSREVNTQLVAAEFLSIENIKPISEDKTDE